MEQNPKGKCLGEEEKDELERPDAAGQDVAKKRSYYYDDAHGYEVFDPEAPDNEDDVTEGGEPSLPFGPS